MCFIGIVCAFHLMRCRHERRSGDRATRRKNRMHRPASPDIYGGMSVTSGQTGRMVSENGMGTIELSSRAAGRD